MQSRVKTVRQDNRLIKWVITLALGVALALAGGGAVARADCAPPSEVKEVRDPAVISRLRDAFDRLQSGGSIKTEVKREALQYDKTKVGKVRASDGVDYLTVTVPVAGQYELPSNVTAVFSTDLDLLSYSETQVWKESGRAYRVKTLNDGAMSNDKTIDVSTVSEQQARQALTQFQASAGAEGTWEVALCLGAILGVDAVVAWLVAGICGSACASGVVPICAACVGGVFALAGVNITGIISCFQLL